ncbi:SDR family NAD(P)-dependent oxidoreductase [Streptomyces sp. NPDC058683]|uniref:SDR family NAD(P)-dependent oxidoreductase n=1 Tax=Streptomyces sp. NPDC058683 TaxID=3346597 RepID=UPI00365AF5BD
MGTAMGNLKGKVALVTGAGRGIGKAVAERLAQDGATVAINYRSSAADAEQLVAELKKNGADAVAIQADVSDPEQTGRLVNQTVEHFGKLDILVSNAGIEHFGRLEEITPEDFDRVFSVNTRGQLFAVQYAARHLPDGGRRLLLSPSDAQGEVRVLVAAGLSVRHDLPPPVRRCFLGHDLPGHPGPCGQGGEVAGIGEVVRVQYRSVRRGGRAHAVTTVRRLLSSVDFHGAPPSTAEGFSDASSFSSRECACSCSAGVST